MSRHLLSPLFALVVPAVSLMGLATTNGCHPKATHEAMIRTFAPAGS